MIAGVDEAGRGPLAGPVVAAAVILSPDAVPLGLADSKKLSAKRRETLCLQIRQQALAHAVGVASVEEIDRLNIFQATLLAMRRAVGGLATLPAEVWVDGNHAPDFGCPARALVRGDATEPAIMAASILAKVTRDAMMDELHARYPQYAFDRHRGYGTALHLTALQAHGPCPAHRRSFRPVSTLLSD